MNKRFSFVILFVVMFLLSGCQDVKKNMKHFQSSWAGLNREITLYSANGDIIEQYEVNTKVEVDGPTVSFINKDGKEIKLSGTISVIEK